MYLMWFDDSAKKTTAQKIADAVAAYNRRWALGATVVLVHADAVTEVPDLVVRGVPWVRRDMFYVGREEGAV